MPVQRHIMTDKLEVITQIINRVFHDVEKFVDCSEFTTAGQYANSECNDHDSIIVGAYNYDDGYNDAIFKFNFDMDYDCLYNDGNASLHIGFLG